MDSQNVFDKAKVINAAKKTLIEIQKERERARVQICTGHKKYGYFGRELTVNEAWDRVSDQSRLLINFLYLGQEIVINRILSVAEKCASDTINLTAQELEKIVDCWE